MSESVSFDLAGALGRLPRVRFLTGPTPVHPLERLRAELGGDSAPRLFIKRDDLNGIALGGNKLRKLEFLVGDAVAQGANALITAGAAQSNHCRLTAAVAAMSKLEAHLCLRGPEPEKRTGNLILDDWLGASIHWGVPGTNISDLMPEVAEALRGAGKSPYIIPIGGSNAVGAAGYATGILEVLEQLPEVDHIVVPVGSGGTMAGLEVAVRLAGMKTKVIGIGVSGPDTVSWNVDVSNLANETAARLGSDQHWTPEDIDCPMGWMGPYYGAPTTGAESAIRHLARLEGIFFDPIYSGKAMHALIDMVRDGRFGPEETVLFWHTGGVPALFAEGH